MMGNLETREEVAFKRGMRVADLHENLTGAYAEKVRQRRDRAAAGEEEGMH